MTISQTFRFAWERFKERPWILVGVVAVAIGIAILTSLILEPILNSNTSVLLKGIVQLADFVVQTFIGMGLTVVALKAHDALGELELKDLWQPDPFFKYLFGVLLVSIITGIGFVLLIIPGIIAMVLLIFVPYLIMDRKIGPIDAIKESARITRGARWQLLFLIIGLALLNLLGVLLVGIGLLVTVPISMLAIVHAYRTLESRAVAVDTPEKESEKETMEDETTA